MLNANTQPKPSNSKDGLIENHLKEFAMAYIQRKPVLKLTVGKLELEDELVKEIEGLETNTDRTGVQHQKQIENTTVDL